MRGCLLLFCAGLLLAVEPEAGERVRVVTDDGRDLVAVLLGRSTEGDLRLRIDRAGMRGEVTIAVDRVLSVGGALSARQQRLQAIATEAAALGADSTAAQHWAWAEECRALGDAIAWRQHLRRCVERDPGHIAAHEALGEVLHEGQWMPLAEAQRARGLVWYEGSWLEPTEVARRETVAAALRERLARERAQRRERLAAARRPAIDWGFGRLGISAYPVLGGGRLVSLSGGGGAVRFHCLTAPTSTASTMTTSRVVRRSSVWAPPVLRLLFPLWR